MSRIFSSAKRGEVIERAVNIEWLMAALICQHYFKKIPAPFLLEVLYDENFTFSLKRRIIEKISVIMVSQVQALNRLNTIRNYFAHCSQEMAYTKAPQNFFVPDPRKPGQPIDFAALYNEFMKLAPDVEEALRSALVAKGGKILEEPLK